MKLFTSSYTDGLAGKILLSLLVLSVPEILNSISAIEKCKRSHVGPFFRLLVPLCVNMLELLLAIEKQ